MLVVVVDADGARCEEVDERDVIDEATLGMVCLGHGHTQLEQTLDVGAIPVRVQATARQVLGAHGTIGV